MRKEIAKEWVEALRSGEYEQGKSRLKSGEGFCCLGVLCDVARKHGQGFWEKLGSGERFVQLLPDDQEMAERNGDTLPKFVQEWAGIKTGDTVQLDGEDGSLELTVRNDEGMPFAAIAALIENNADDI